MRWGIFWDTNTTNARAKDVRHLLCFNKRLDCKDVLRIRTFGVKLTTFILCKKHK